MLVVFFSLKRCFISIFTIFFLLYILQNNLQHIAWVNDFCMPRNPSVLFIYVITVEAFILSTYCVSYQSLRIHSDLWQLVLLKVKITPICKSHLFKTTKCLLNYLLHISRTMYLSKGRNLLHGSEELFFMPGLWCDMKAVLFENIKRVMTSFTDQKSWIHAIRKLMV